MASDSSGFDPRTAEAMREAFQGESCCKCGSPASRRKRGRFFCHSCFLWDVPQKRHSRVAKRQGERILRSHFKGR